MHPLRALFVIGASIILAACKTADVRQDVPARIIDGTPAGRAELQRIVSRALGTEAVAIADDALSNDSLLTIEPSHLMGRDLRRPERFRLLLNGSNCVLMHLGPDTRYDLSDIRCVAE